MTIIEPFKFLTEQLNNREIATLIWLAIILVFVLFKSSLRGAFWDIIKAFSQFKILIVFLLLAINVGGVSFLLSKISLWSVDNLVTTVLWYFTSGSVFIMQSITKENKNIFFKDLLWDNLKAILFAAFTFSLIAEFFIFPILTILTVSLVVAEKNKNFASTKSIIEGLLILFGVIIIGRSIIQIWSDPFLFFTISLLRNFLIPVFLAIGLFPFLYFLYCYSFYELARIRINLQNAQSKELKKYAWWRFRLYFVFHPPLFEQAIKRFHFQAATENADVDRIICQVLSYNKNQKNPPQIDSSKGWCPYLGKNFLQDRGLQTTDYYEKDGECFACSNQLDLDDERIANSVCFYLEGQQPDLVTLLKLKGYFTDEYLLETSQEKFRCIGIELTSKALGITKEEAVNLIPSDLEFNLTVQDTQIASYCERYPNSNTFSHYFILSRTP